MNNLSDDQIVRGTSIGITLNAGVNKKLNKKKPGARLWVSINLAGATEFIEADKHAVTRRVPIPLRDLRVLGPLFSQSAAIMARGRAMLVNLEHIKAVITAEEVLVLNPLDEEVSPFVNKVKKQLQVSSTDLQASSSQLFAPETPPKPNSPRVQSEIDDAEFKAGTMHSVSPKLNQQRQSDLPFEFLVLELILETALLELEGRTKELIADATSAMEVFRKNVSTESLERVRSVKARMTRLTARVQNVREELEQLLDDDDDMRDLYLTRNQQQAQLRIPDSPGGTSSAKGGGGGSLEMYGSEAAASSDVEDLEMLLEAYFMQVDEYLNKLNNLRVFIDDTEGIVNIELDYRRNQLIEFQLNLTASDCVIGVVLVLLGAGSMNVPFWMFELTSQIGFNVYLSSAMFVSLLAFVGLHFYFRHWRLLGS